MSHFEAKMTPATAKEGTAELLACLTLVAPSGMTTEDRHAWVAVAKATLTGIPADLLKRGCKVARETCRFASEIVPAIVAETKAEWERRQRRLAEEQAAYANRHAPQLEQPEYVGAGEVAKLLAELKRAA
jgi:hypothetical protein